MVHMVPTGGIRSTWFTLLQSSNQLSICHTCMNKRAQTAQKQVTFCPFRTVGRGREGEGKKECVHLLPCDRWSLFRFFLFIVRLALCPFLVSSALPHSGVSYHFSICWANNALFTKTIIMHHPILHLLLLWPPSLLFLPFPSSPFSQGSRSRVHGVAAGRRLVNYFIFFR